MVTGVRQPICIGPMEPEQLNLGQTVSPGQAGERPWLGVHFVCSNKYVRVYRDADGSRYQARCPLCGRCAIFRVGNGGTSSRQFDVSCR